MDQSRAPTDDRAYSLRFRITWRDLPIPWFLIIGALCALVYAGVLLFIGIGWIGSSSSPDSATAQPLVLLLGAVVVAYVVLRLRRGWLNPLKSLAGSDVTVAIGDAGLQVSNGMGSAATDAWSTLSGVSVKRSRVLVLGRKGAPILWIPKRVFALDVPLAVFRNEITRRIAAVQVQGESKPGAPEGDLTASS